jgi:hypothetical protein
LRRENDSGADQAQVAAEKSIATEEIDDNKQERKAQIWHNTGHKTRCKNNLFFIVIQTRFT